MRAWRIFVLLSMYLPLHAQELFTNKSYFELYLQSLMYKCPDNQHIYRLFLEKLKNHNQKQLPSAALFFQDAHVFAHGRYCVKTVINKDLEKSIFYIEQFLYKTNQQDVILCSLKGSIIQNPWDNYCFVAHIETPEQFRQQGYARSLMCSLERLAYHAQCEKVTLDATKKAIGFYQKLGYSYDNTRLDDFDDTVPMSKPAPLFCVHGSRIYSKNNVNNSTNKLR